MNGRFLSAVLSSIVLAAPIPAPSYIPAQTANSATVAALVTVPVPPGMDRVQIEQNMAASAAPYKNAPGLIRKYFILSTHKKVGGIYLWTDRRAAEAWYKEHPVWRAVVTKNPEPHADITSFDAPIVTNGPVDGARAASPVAVLVEVPLPPGLDCGKIEAAMAKTVPTYEIAPGLIRKYFIIAEDQKFGGIYLWESHKAAEAWYNESPAWHNGVSKLTGFSADLTFFDVPVVVEGARVASPDPQ